MLSQSVYFKIKMFAFRATISLRLDLCLESVNFCAILDFVKSYLTKTAPIPAVKNTIEYE